VWNWLHTRGNRGLLLWILGGRGAGGGLPKVKGYIGALEGGKGSYGAAVCLGVGVGGRCGGGEGDGGVL